MIYFNNDYSEGCLPQILEKLKQTNMEQTIGYVVDPYCHAAAELIKQRCNNDALSIHFLVGGTQTNLTVIASALRPFQAVIAAHSGHISVHETGAIEATGHKVIELSAIDGKISAEQIAHSAASQSESMDREHTVQPKMVYLSSPTEYGTLYSLKELEEIRKVCDHYGLYLFVDGARMGYGLTAEGNDVWLPDFARLCDVFYIGGTKVGALFGEAVVFRNLDLAKDFRYMIKQRGGMLAKGRLLGIQFGVLLEDGLYEAVSARANKLADRIRETLDKLSVRYYVKNTTNQIFPILPHAVLDMLAKDFCFSEIENLGEEGRVVRFCTSWATTEENVLKLCAEIESAYSGTVNSGADR